MEIVPDLTKGSLSKNQVEYIQKKQHEYKLTDKKKKIPGHTLFSFNLKTKEIKRASITNEVSIGLNGKPIMKSKQVLSIEQMKHLQELGLDTSDASMCWARVSHGTRIDDKSKGVWFLSLHKGFQTCGFMSYEILPTYTLQDILDKLPESVQVYDLYIFKKVGLWWLKYVDVTNNGTVRLEKMPKLIDAAYYMLCWCIQKGFVKTNKEVKDGRKEN